MKTKNPRTKELLKYLALGSGIIVLSMLNPFLPHKLLKTYIKHRRIQKRRFLEDLKRLQNRKLIDFEILNDNEVKITLKRRGKIQALKYDIDDIKLDKRKWDGKWRLIIFDFPKNVKRARDVFREKLKELNFYKLQKSVYITPYSCENEIDFICEFFKIRKYLLILTISDFEGKEKLKYYFKL